MSKFSEGKGFTAEWRAGGADDPIPLLLRVRMPRAPELEADILWAHKRWQRDALTRTITLSMSGREVFVLHPEDLILLKLEAGGPQDLLDVAGLLSESQAEIDPVRLSREAARLHLDALLAKCLRQNQRTGKKKPER